MDSSTNPLSPQPVKTADDAQSTVSGAAASATPAEPARPDIAEMKKEKTLMLTEPASTPLENLPFLGWTRHVKNMLPGLRKKTEIRQAVEEIIFKPNGFLTLGVETEFNLIDPATGQLVQRSADVLKNGALLKKLHAEYFASMAETVTGICHTVHDVSRDMKETFASLSSICGEIGIGLATTARHPTALDEDNKIADIPRYNELAERMRWLRRQMIVGMHVHIGMRDHRDCIRYNNFFLHFIPHLIALSASSPFWEGKDTLLMSSRPTAYESIPTSGQPYPLASWTEFEELYWSLRNCGAINSLKDLWWDVRPSPKYGTLEIRACDGIATHAETMAITAFIHALSHWFADNMGWLDHMPRPPHWVARENKWRAMRHGVRAELVVTGNGDTKNLVRDINDWLVKLQPYITELQYEPYMVTLRQILMRGNSAERQRQIYSATHDFKEVVAFNMREFAAGAPLWDECETRSLDAKGLKDRAAITQN